jgi:hypothetical protein
MAVVRHPVSDIAIDVSTHASERAWLGAMVTSNGPANLRQRVTRQLVKNVRCGVRPRREINRLGAHRENTRISSHCFREPERYECDPGESHYEQPVVAAQFRQTEQVPLFTSGPPQF